VETVRQLLRDLPNLPCAPTRDPDAVTKLLDERSVAYVTMDQWLALDRHEQELGVAEGRPRVKVHNVGSMLHFTRQHAAIG
jgi:ferredoxin--NADP+ reductase